MKGHGKSPTGRTVGFAGRGTTPRRAAAQAFASGGLADAYERRNHPVVPVVRMHASRACTVCGGALHLPGYSRHPTCWVPRAL